MAEWKKIITSGSVAELKSLISEGNLTISGTKIILKNLPLEDPQEAGKLWNNGSRLCVSEGWYMTTWKKLINSGSNAHVASLNISDTPSDVSSSIQDGSVFFSALPVQPVPNDLPVGTLMKSVSPAVDGGLSRYVMISNNFVATTGADYVIPPNQTAIACDLNNDGNVSTADLLMFLGNYGTVGNSGDDILGDITGDGIYGIIMEPME